MRSPDAAVVRRFQRKLLTWYGKHGRDLPWRRTRDPYRVLVSEVMLQQTQVDRVVPKYHEFLERYPTWRDLAQAPTADVKRTWRPLGYNVRPVRLQAIARETLKRYDGRLPDDARALRSMRGIGPYTAGAVMSFAYGRDVPILDTNVRRVIARVFLGARRVARIRGDRAYWALAGALVPRGRGYDFNQALMDFGATWCTARRPRCAPCTMRSFCSSYDPRGERFAEAALSGSPRLRLRLARRPPSRLSPGFDRAGVAVRDEPKARRARRIRGSVKRARTEASHRVRPAPLVGRVRARGLASR